MRLDHPIFNKPIAAGVTLKPNDWEKDYDSRGVWTVQTGEVGTEKGNDYGVVSDGHGFEDSPDCERISGGINSKGPRAVAIGRQANMLQWGFYAAPDRMTPSARKVFLNAIVYMNQFDGRRPLVEKTSRGRSWYEQYVAAVRKLSDKDRKNPSGYAKYLAQRFPKELVAKVGLDADALEKWRRENVEYFHAERRYSIVIDEDLRQLGLSNRKPGFLKWVTSRLTANARDELGLRLANRYLGDAHGADAASALAYILKNRDRLFFSDSGGFRWFVNPHAKEGSAARPGGGQR